MRPDKSDIAWGIGALAIIALTIEGTVRLDDWAQFGVPMRSPVVSIDELAVRDSLGFHARAGTAFRQFHINSLGFRGPEVKLPEHQGALVIAAGASETFGLYESAGKEWPRQMSDSLRSCGNRVVVLNAAFAGMSLPTVRQDFERRLRPLAPRVVVYYPTPMQYLYGKAPVAAEPAVDVPPPLSPWRSRAFPRFRDAVKRGVPQPLLDLFRRVDTWRARNKSGITAKSEVEMQRLDSFERDLRSLIGTYRSAGATPVLIVHSNRFADTTSPESRRWLAAWERFYPSYTGEAIVRYDRLAAERTIGVARDSLIPVVDPRKRLASVSGAFSDYSHFNDSGAAVVGGMAARTLEPLLCGSVGRASSAATIRD